MKKICENPKIKLRTLIRKSHSKWNVDLTKTKAARVKQQALDEINGTYGEQYRRIHDYAAELLKELHSVQTTIGLDGCFIKAPYEGQLLTAIGWDHNDKILSIAYAIEAETKDTWTWFLSNLCDNLGVDKIRRCTFMSDQQKKKILKYSAENDDVEGCNGNIYVQERERRMKEIQMVDQGAYNHFMEIPAKYWNKSRDKYEVSSSQANRDKFVVDLKNHECSCRKFQLTGYPCEHVMSCIRKMCLDVKNYVNYVDCYQHVIYPMNGPNLWDRTQNDDVLPPVFKKPIGRPKLSRNKTGDESCNNGPLSKLSRDHNATPEAKKSARTTRILNPSKNAAKTTTKATIKLQPKRKSNT
ncbi:uncharacterized protein [Arachis hypogaea]|uniref:uncharacterized protein n=1 Tax=Arachis hypogaea TaxID=3818 RepID=UPI003B20FE00